MIVSACHRKCSFEVSCTICALVHNCRLLVSVCFCTGKQPQVTGEYPTGPPTEPQTASPPVTARRSESEAPATLTCASDPDPAAEGGGAQGKQGLHATRIYVAALMLHQMGMSLSLVYNTSPVLYNKLCA